MTELEIILATVCGVILFLFAIENFSREIQQVSGEKFRKFIAKGTRNPILGLFLGAGVTSIIQSSTATSVIAVGLVNAGVLSFKNSLCIIFGANIGTTVTAQLVAFKLTSIAPYFIILGFALSLMRLRYSFIGKSIFFFGFVFFSLNLISNAVTPLQADPRIVEFLAQARTPIYGVLLGALVTAVVQSSSVTTGLTVVMVQNNLMTFEGALPVILGANIGTTVTALLASMKMDAAARRTAISHLLYNVGGVIIFLPIILKIPDYFSINQDNASHALANVHLVFNSLTAFLFLILVTPFAKVLEKLIPAKEDEFLRPVSFPATSDLENTKQGISFLEKVIWETLNLLKRNYNLVTLALESKEENLLKRCVKNQSYLGFLKSEIQDFISQLSPLIQNEEESRELVRKVNRIDYLYQISDSIEDLVGLNQQAFERKVSFSVETIMGFREVSGEILKVFEHLPPAIHNEEKKLSKSRFTRSLSDYNKVVEGVYSDVVQAMSTKGEQDASYLARFLSLNQRIKDKLQSFYKLSEAKRRVTISLEPKDSGL
jgi:phosphate:Na+ symporter